MPQQGVLLRVQYSCLFEMPGPLNLHLASEAITGKHFKTILPSTSLNTPNMCGGISRAELLATSSRISIAVRHFKQVRRGVCRHLPLTSLDKAGEESLWVALRSTCEFCHSAYVSLPKATHLAWKDYVPLKCIHEGKLWDIKVKSKGQPAGTRRAQL